LITDKLGGVLLGGTTFDTRGFTVTGLRFVCEKFSLLGVGASPNTTIPGSANGTVGPDCQAF
jgi:hypothetical protein